MKDRCSSLYSHNLFAPFHGRRYPTAVAVSGRSVSVLVSGKLLPIPIRNRYQQYRPIPDTRYRYRSQPNYRKSSVLTHMKAGKVKVTDDDFKFAD